MEKKFSSKNIGFKNIITTLVAISMFGISIFIYIAPYIIKEANEIEKDWYVPVIPIIIGIVLLFMSDDTFKKLLNIGEKYIDKK